MQRQILGDLAQLAPSKYLVKVLIGSERPMGSMLLARHFGESRFVGFDESRHVGVETTVGTIGRARKDQHFVAFYAHATLFS
jgi:hypothetical protein